MSWKNWIVGASGALMIAAAQPAPQPYDFKSIPLGISIDEFRKMAHPDGRQGLRVVCTGEVEDYRLAVYGAAADLGVKQCGFYGIPDRFTKFEQIVGFNLGGGEYGSIDQTLAFVPDPVDQTLKLYMVATRTNILALDDLLPALTAKFGAPKILKGSMQTKGGGTFDQATYVWDNGVSSITMQTRFTKVDDLGLIYRHKRLGALVDKAEAGKKSAVPNRI